MIGPLNSLENLFAQVETVRKFHELAPLFPLNNWLQFGLLALIVVSFVVYAIWMYTRDGVEISRTTTSLLFWFRLATILGLVLFFLNPEERTEKLVTKPSRVAVVLDTSISMGIRDRVAGQAVTGEKSRLDQVGELVQGTPFIEKLRENHDVAVYRFDDGPVPEEVQVLPKTSKNAGVTAVADSVAQQVASKRVWGWLGVVLFIGGVLGWGTMIGFGIANASGGPVRWIGLLGGIGMVAGFVLLALTHLSVSETTLPQLLGLQTLAADKSNNSKSGEPGQDVANKVNWDSLNTPRGISTRLGEALRHVVTKERGGPIAGIVMLTDGCKNQGIEPEFALAAAQDAKIPIYPIGFGSSERLSNIRVTDIRAPKRVFPSDNFIVRGSVQAVGNFTGTVKAELVSTDESGREAEQIEGEKEVVVGEDVGPVDVQFQVARTEQGKRTYILRVKPGPEDFNPADNERRATVEVLERKTLVMLIAGGPTREYNFVRNQFYRDKEIDSHVWLQSAPDGVSQESDKLLTDFPTEMSELEKYDAIVAFDPDWRRLSVVQAKLLEQWVSEKAGGLVVVAGPIYTPLWTRTPRGNEAIDSVRKLYPVTFFSQGSGSIKVGRFGGSDPFPLDYSREGASSEFLWLGDSFGENADNQKKFEGVYGYYAVNESKPGATVFARFSDPTTAFGGVLPIYLAGQFYGGGRVFFQASGEMWRLREVEVALYEKYYTKLLRWVSQGRLLRDSTRGVLLVDKERGWIGEQLGVQAILRDAQDQPLTASEVSATVLRPDRVTETVLLKALAAGAKPGSFATQYPIRQEGDYRISLTIPGSTDPTPLVAEFHAEIPQLENDRPELNEPLLQNLANGSGGTYVKYASNPDAQNKIVETISAIPSREQQSYLPGTSNPIFSRSLMIWLLCFIAGTLCMEWLTRRLHKLA